MAGGAFDNGQQPNATNNPLITPFTNLRVDPVELEQMAQEFLQQFIHLLTENILSVIESLTGIDLANIISSIPFLSNLLAFFDPIDFTSSSFNPVTALEQFVQMILSGIESIIAFPLTAVGQLVSNLEALLGGFTGIASGGFNPILAVEHFIENMISPTGLLAPLVDGILPDANAPQIVQDIIDAVINGWNAVGTDIFGSTPQALYGLFATLLQSITTLTQQSASSWNLIATLGGVIHQANDDLSQIPIYADAEDFLANMIPAAASAVTSAVGAFGGLISSIDNWWLALTGQTTRTDSGTSSTATAAQLQHLATTVVATASAVNDLTAGQNAGSNSGISGMDDFERTNTSNLGTGWSIAYTVPSTGSVMATPDGHTASITGGSANTLAMCLRTDPTDYQTLTDYQIVSVVYSGTISQWPFFNTSSTVNIYGRVNSTFTDYVRVKITEQTATLSYAIGGVEYALPTGVSDSAPCDQAAGVKYSLVCGLIGSKYEYQVLRNGQAIITWTDSGSLTHVDASHRGWGFGLGTGTSGTIIPAKIDSVTITDNYPASVVGTGFRVFRASTSTVSITSTGAFPTGLYDTFDYVSPNVTFSTGNTFTCTTPGWYEFDVRTLHSGQLGQAQNAFGNVWRPSLYVNGVRKADGDAVAALSNGNTYVAIDSFKDVWVIYLNNGDTVTPGLGAYAGQILAKGDAVGVSTYFAGTLVSGTTGAAA